MARHNVVCDHTVSWHVYWHNVDFYETVLPLLVLSIYNHYFLWSFVGYLMKMSHMGSIPSQVIISLKYKYE